MARVYYSNLLCYLGRPEEAIVQAERALELDPFNSLFMGIYGNALVYLGRYDDAMVQARKALRTSPNDPVGHSILWESLHVRGQYEEALEEAKAFFIGIGLAPIAEAMSSGYERNGYSGAMRSAADTLAVISQETFVGPWFIAFVYGAAGEKEQTLEWLERGYKIGDPNLPYIGGHGILNSLLREDPRYQDLLRRMGIPKYLKE
jgi:tetratricopeptide (TPR) repeat protein